MELRSPSDTCCEDWGANARAHAPPSNPATSRREHHYLTRPTEESCVHAAWAGPTSRAVWGQLPQVAPLVQPQLPHPSTPPSKPHPSTHPEAVTRARAARCQQRPRPPRNDRRSQRVRPPLLRVQPRLPPLNAIVDWDTLTPVLCGPKTPGVLSRRAPTRCPAQAMRDDPNRRAPRLASDQVLATHTCDVTRRVDAPST